MENKKILLFACLSVLVILISITIGSSQINLFDVINVLSNFFFHSKLANHISETQVIILTSIRLPRVLLAFLVGAALSSSGCIVQSVLKNPLATPYTLGVSSGAGLGVGIVIVFGLALPIFHGYDLAIVGFLSGMLTVLGVIVFSSKTDRDLSGTSVVLIGMIFSLFLSALLNVLSYFAYDKMQAIALWQMGTFSLRGWDYLTMFIPFLLLGCLALCFYVRELDILTFGDDAARLLGVDVSKKKKQLLSISALLTGSSVAICGIIGFIDLIAPHLARKVVGNKHSHLLPMSFLIGGNLMVIADTVARTILSPSELPVGAVIALIGAPLFAYIYFDRMKKYG